jgi:hypothetical protein
MDTTKKIKAINFIVDRFYFREKENEYQIMLLKK